ncbi:MAG: hypothetical protein AAF198_01580 [Pseudomonadota bacterium]
MDEPRYINGCVVRKRVLTNVRAKIEALPKIGGLVTISKGHVPEITVLMRNAWVAHQRQVAAGRI